MISPHFEHSGEPLKSAKCINLNEMQLSGYTFDETLISHCDFRQEIVFFKIHNFATISELSPEAISVYVKDSVRAGRVISVGVSRM